MTWAERASAPPAIAAGLVTSRPESELPAMVVRLSIPAFQAAPGKAARTVTVAIPVLVGIVAGSWVPEVSAPAALLRGPGAMPPPPRAPPGRQRNTATP